VDTPPPPRSRRLRPPRRRGRPPPRRWRGAAARTLWTRTPGPVAAPRDRGPGRSIPHLPAWPRQPGARAAADGQREHDDVQICSCARARRRAGRRSSSPPRPPGQMMRVVWATCSPCSLMSPFAHHAAIALRATLLPATLAGSRRTSPASHPPPPATRRGSVPAVIPAAQEDQRRREESVCLQPCAPASWLRMPPRCGRPLEAARGTSPANSKSSPTATQQSVVGRGSRGPGDGIGCGSQHRPHPQPRRGRPLFAQACGTDDAEAKAEPWLATYGDASSTSNSCILRQCRGCRPGRPLSCCAAWRIRSSLSSPGTVPAPGVRSRRPRNGRRSLQLHCELLTVCSLATSSLTATSSSTRTRYSASSSSRCLLLWLQIMGDLLDKDLVPNLLLEPLPPPLAADNDWCRTGAGLSP
jgi:hypothetical protein